MESELLQGLLDNLISLALLGFAVKYFMGKLGEKEAEITRLNNLLLEYHKEDKRELYEIASNTTTVIDAVNKTIKGLFNNDNK